MGFAQRRGERRSPRPRRSPKAPDALKMASRSTRSANTREAMAATRRKLRAVVGRGLETGQGVTRARDRRSRTADRETRPAKAVEERANGVRRTLQPGRSRGRQRLRCVNPAPGPPTSRPSAISWIFRCTDGARGAQRTQRGSEVSARHLVPSSPPSAPCSKTSGRADAQNLFPPRLPRDGGAARDAMPSGCDFVAALGWPDSCAVLFRAPGSRSPRNGARLTDPCPPPWAASARGGARVGEKRVAFRVTRARADSSVAARGLADERRA